MRDLHEQLRSLVSQHGVGIAENAEQFRAALDDYLTEQDASQGELNLLVDAVRLGDVDRLKTMLDNGADAEAAVREAGGELARDRSSDEQRARWAVAALGYALGRVGIDTVRQQLEGDATRLPFGATAPAAQRPPVQSPPYEPPVQSPPQQQPAQSPPHQQAWPGQGGYPAPAYAPPPRKSRAGLIGALVAGAVALAVAIVLVVVAPWDGDDDKAEDNAGTGGNGETAGDCDPCVEGDGYSYQLPEGWTDVTDTIPDSGSGAAVLDTASALGGTIEQSRANVIVEISAWVYTDLDEAKETFKTNLESSLSSPTSEEIEGRSIDGEEAVGLRVTSTNENGIEVEQTAYLMRRDDDAIVIYASNEVGDEGPQDAYEGVYDSWSWE
jgi:hypothetical protein